MRLAGRISDWNDDKGYGFVTPNGGGDRAFVHIKAFQSGSRRPVDGDLISYAVTRDGRGRSNAAEVRFAGQRIAQRKPTRAPTRIPRRLLRSEEHTSELQSLMRISYAVFCLKKKKSLDITTTIDITDEQPHH